LENETTDLHDGLVAFGREFRPCGLFHEVNDSVFGDVVDADFQLNHAGIVVFSNLTERAVCRKDYPAVLRIGVGEVSGFGPPKGNRLIIFHQID
jgi:hypothetical protein